MKSNNFFTRRISTKLIALFLAVSVIPVVIIGIVSYSNAKNALKKSIAETLTTATVSKAHHVEDVLNSTMDLVLCAASLPSVRENLGKIEKGVEVKLSIARLKEIVSDFEKNSNTFYQVVILNSKGMVVASTRDVVGEALGENQSGQDYFREGLKGHFFSEPYRSNKDGIKQIAYAAPVYDRAMVPIGVVVIHQALDALNNEKETGKGVGLNDITASAIAHAETCETYIVNGEKSVFSRVHADTAAFLKFKVLPFIFENTAVDDAVLEPYVDYSGTLAIGKAIQIHGTNWVMIGEFDVEEAFAPVYKLQNQMIVISLIIIVLVTLLAWAFSHYFAAPIIKLTETAQSMATGVLDQEFTISRSDELGQLGESFKAMQHSLQVKAGEAQQIAEGNLSIDIQLLSDNDVMGKSFKTMLEKLRLQFHEIGEGINVLASSSSEIMASVTQLAASSAETATSVGETTTTVEEVKQTAEVANQKARAVSENAVRTTEISSDGAKAIANTIEGMNKIRQHMNAIAGMVVRLSDQSQTIGEITATVNELAEQSNLLAVNAAIEAAKAGEQGKGFTVVAQEIKMLADRSKEATSQVRTILREIQKSISSAVMATEEGGKAVDEGLKLTARSGDTIKTLSESVAEAAKAAIQIAASSQQQLEGMDQVVTAMENIKEASMQSAASTQQSAESVRDLQRVGQKLDGLMKQYKLVK